MEVFVVGDELFEAVKKLDSGNLFDFKIDHYENGDPSGIYGKSVWIEEAEILAQLLYDMYNNLDFVEVDITLDVEGGLICINFNDRLDLDY